METFFIISFTHRNIDVNEIGKLHIAEDQQCERLNVVKKQMNLRELMFLSTCNRVEFLLVSEEVVDFAFLNHFFAHLYPDFKLDFLVHLAQHGIFYRGIDAVEHIFSVASSIDSMVVGEREIITQVRNAFDNSRKHKLTGDCIRLLMRHTIETAKRVYTETSIAKKPVSVVSLAYHKLKSLAISLDSRILIVGAGVTNTNMGKFLKKHGFKNFVVFNRTLSKAEKLAQDLNGKHFPLEDLSKFNGGFDAIITCTGSEHHILTPEIYENLLQGETDKKVIIDLALPSDLDPKIKDSHNISHISIELLQKISDQNLKERSLEIQHVEEIISESLFSFRNIERKRKVEIAMREVPLMVKDIKSKALTQIFKDDIETMDPNSQEVLNKVMAYMEKKYMSMPMLMAKEILLKN